MRAIDVGDENRRSGISYGSPRQEVVTNNVITRYVARDPVNPFRGLVTFSATVETDFIAALTHNTMQGQGGRDGVPESPNERDERAGIVRRHARFRQVSSSVGVLAIAMRATLALSQNASAALVNVDAASGTDRCARRDWASSRARITAGGSRLRLLLAVIHGAAFKARSHAFTDRAGYED